MRNALKISKLFEKCATWRPGIAPKLCRETADRKSNYRKLSPSRRNSFAVIDVGSSELEVNTRVFLLTGLSQTVKCHDQRRNFCAFPNSNVLGAKPEG